MKEPWSDDDTMALLKRIFNRTMLAESVAREEKAEGLRLKHIYEGAFADIRALTQEFPLARTRERLAAGSPAVPAPAGDGLQILSRDDRGRRANGVREADAYEKKEEAK